MYFTQLQPPDLINRTKPSRIQDYIRRAWARLRDFLEEPSPSRERTNIPFVMGRIYGEKVLTLEPCPLPLEPQVSVASPQSIHYGGATEPE
jgi:hypothetical protein